MVDMHADYLETEERMTKYHSENRASQQSRNIPNTLYGMNTILWSVERQLFVTAHCEIYLDKHGQVMACCLMAPKPLPNPNAD